MGWNTGLTSSKRKNWATPKRLFAALDARFKFNFDPCPSNPTFDGLMIPWKERNFVNPPYGREISRWVEKGYMESWKGNLVVMLLPARTDTSWWHSFVMWANEIWFIRGRLCFDDCGKPAPFPSAIVIFSGRSVPDSPHVRAIDTQGNFISSV